MNYRHLYHAGNAVDVIKHCLLIRLLDLMSKKEKPWFYLETHAGIGKYDLTAIEALKTQEAADGIEKIWSQLSNQLILKHYHSIILQLNPDRKLRFYPGSPYFAEQCARKNDKLVLCELHPQDFLALKKNLGRKPQIHFHERDGYGALKALLPPTPARGLVFIDPPYEHVNEMQHIIDHLTVALKRWPHGSYAIWYPIKDVAAVKQFKFKCRSAFNNFPICIAEIMLQRHVGQQLIGSGMVVINPPWQFETFLKPLLETLRSLLASDGGAINIE